MPEIGVGHGVHWEFGHMVLCIYGRVAINYGNHWGLILPAQCLYGDNIAADIAAIRNYGAKNPNWGLKSVGIAPDLALMLAIRSELTAEMLNKGRESNDQIILDYKGAPLTIISAQRVKTFRNLNTCGGIIPLDKAGRQLGA